VEEISDDLLDCSKAPAGIVDENYQLKYRKKATKMQ
jgi:hypothetical protein